MQGNRYERGESNIFTNLQECTQEWSPLSESMFTWGWIARGSGQDICSAKPLLGLEKLLLIDSAVLSANFPLPELELRSP